MHTCDCICVGIGDEHCQSVSFCSVHPATALRFHYVVALGSENVGFNWNLFRPLGAWLVESDPSVSCCLSIQWLKNMMRQVACFWMDMSANACHILMTSLLKRLFNDGRAAFIRLKCYEVLLWGLLSREIIFISCILYIVIHHHHHHHRTQQEKEIGFEVNNYTSVPDWIYTWSVSSFEALI